MRWLRERGAQQNGGYVSLSFPGASNDESIRLAVRGQYLSSFQGLAQIHLLQPSPQRGLPNSIQTRPGHKRSPLPLPLQPAPATGLCVPAPQVVKPDRNPLAALALAQKLAFRRMRLDLENHFQVAEGCAGNDI